MKITRTIIIILIAFPLSAMEDRANDRLLSLRGQIISPEENELAEVAHDVFNRLLNHWEDIRAPTVLHVVDVDEGPWAFTLDSGEVMITLSAIKTSLGKNVDEGMSRLAFVLAHELAHWRLGDLWHMRVNRMRGLSLDKFEKKDRKDFEDKEVRADAEGLLHMVLAGYDPMAVVAGERDFFTAWVESLLGVSCDTVDAKRQQSVKDVCYEAQRRVEYSLDQLQEVASHSLLFELGIQFYVAGQYESARDHFYEFGRNYPSQAIHTNIGLSYLAEVYNDLRNYHFLPNVSGELLQFIYPAVIASVEYNFDPALEWELKKRKEWPGMYMSHPNIAGRMDHYKREAISSFDSVFEQAKDDRQTYIHLCVSYLVWRNIPMAKGILHGEYVPKFGNDPGARFLEAMVAISEGNYDESRDLFLRLASMSQNALDDAIINKEMFLYAVAHNLVKLSKYTTGREISDERASPHDLLASLTPVEHYTLPQVPFIVGEKVDKRVLLENAKYHKKLWIGRRLLHSYEFIDGLNVVVDNYGIVMALWGKGGDTGVRDDTEISKVIESSPDRQVATERGRYLAYDQLGLAYHVTDDGVDSWFYYPIRH